MVAVSMIRAAPPAVEAAGAPLDVRHVVPALYPGHPSGANGVHNVARALAREQIAAGDDASLVLLSPDVGQPAPADTVPTRVVPIEGPVLRGRIVRLDRRTIQAVLEGAGPRTVFHIHGGREPLMLGLTRALRQRGIPYVVTIHGRYSHAYSDTGRRLRHSTALYLELLERPMLEGALCVQALSEEEARVVRRVAPAARIAILGNGAYSSRIGSLPPWPGTRLPSDSFPHFGWCGRYEIGHKGLDLLLEGFALYRQSGGTGRLTMIGSGTGREECARRAEALGIAGEVTLNGPMFGAERDAVLRRCDAFIMPSRFEGIPLAALEAALLGLPLVVTAGTGLRGAVEAHGAGLPILATSAEAVRDAMHRMQLLPLETWQRLGIAAHHMALTMADWTRIGARLRDLYLGAAPDAAA